jgi:Flp pilus assembly protein TadD
MQFLFLIFCIFLPFVTGLNRVGATENVLELLEIEPSLFGLQAINFASGSNIAMQQEYLFKEAETSIDQPGLLLFNLNQYIKNVDESSAPEESRLRWLALNKKLSNLNEEQQLLFMSFYILQSFPEVSDEIKKEFLNQTTAESARHWIRFMGALIAFTAIENKASHVLPEGYDIETALRKASVQNDTEALFHFALSNFYWHFLKNEENPYKRMRLVVQEYEKSRVRDPANRGLFTTITGKYISLHQEFQENEIPEPFEFEELLYTRIIMLEPRNPWAHNNLAFLYCQNNVRLNEALKQATIANQLESDNPYFLDTLGWCLYRHKRYQESEAVLKRAIEIEPGLAEVHFHLASVYSDMGNLPEAAESFKKCLQIEPGHALSLNNLAYMYAEMDTNLDEALEMALKAVEMTPGNSAFLDTLGWLYFKKGDYKKALPYLKQASELDEKAWETHMHLGLAYQKNGDSQKADFHLQKAAELNPAGQKQSPETGDFKIIETGDSAQQLLMQAIRAAKDSYLKAPGVAKDKNSVKVFYDLQIYLAQLQGDTGLIQQLAKELENYQEQNSVPVIRRRPAVSSSGIVNKSSESPSAEKTVIRTSEQADAIKSTGSAIENWKTEIAGKKELPEPEAKAELITIEHFFPSETDFYLNIRSGILKNFLHTGLKNLAFFAPQLPLSLLANFLDAGLPLQISLFSGIFAPIKANLQYAVLEFSPEQLDTLRKNAHIFTGRNIFLPHGYGEINITEMDSNNYTITVNNVTFFVTIQAPYVIVAPNLLITARLPLDTEKSLSGNLKVRETMRISDSSDYAVFYAGNLAEYYRKYVPEEEMKNFFGPEDSSALKQLISGIGEYFCFFRLSDRGFAEYEVLNFHSAQDTETFLNLANDELLGSVFTSIGLSPEELGLETEIVKSDEVKLEVYTVMQNFSAFIFHFLQSTISFQELYEGFNDEEEYDEKLNEE